MWCSITENLLTKYKVRVVQNTSAEVKSSRAVLETIKKGSDHLRKEREKYSCVYQVSVGDSPFLF